MCAPIWRIRLGLTGTAFPRQQPALTRLFELTGGLAIAKRRHGLAARTAIARQLLTEALGHVWRGGASRRAAIPGYSITDFTDAGSNAIIQATSRSQLTSRSSGSSRLCPASRLGSPLGSSPRDTSGRSRTRGILPTESMASVRRLRTCSRRACRLPSLRSRLALLRRTIGAPRSAC